MYLERKLKRKKIKRILIVVIPILILLIGSSFAFFTFYKANEAFILTMKGVPMQVEFKEGDNVIEVPFAYPISDEYAKENLSKLGYVDFTVRGGTPNNEYLYYELYLTEEDGNTLDSNYIKVYLTDDNNREVVEPSIYNKLSKSTSDNKNGKILYNESLTGIFEKNYRLYVWIDKDYTQNKVNQTFSFKVNLYAYNGLGSATNVIKSKLVKYEESSKDDFGGGLVAVNTDGELYNETDSSQKIREYRYSGLNVNNYVTFNDETWRILGNFKDEKGEEHVKIVRNEILKREAFPVTYIVNGETFNIQYTGGDYVYWDKPISGSSYNNWTEAGLMYWLNSLGTTDGYLKTLSTNAQNMIEDAKWYLGTVSYLGSHGINDTTVEAYKMERAITGCSDNKGPNTNNSMVAVEGNSACRVWANNAATWTGKIGLMYPSDYGYSADSSYWSRTKLYSYNSAAANTSWLQKETNHSTYEWLLSPSVDVFDHIARWYTNGMVGSISASDGHAMRLALYLKSDVKITSGNGTKDNQYELSID